MAAPADGTWEGLRETSVSGRIIYGDIRRTLDLDVNDIGTKARGQCIMHAVAMTDCDLV